MIQRRPIDFADNPKKKEEEEQSSALTRASTLSGASGSIAAQRPYAMVTKKTAYEVPTQAASSRPKATQVQKKNPYEPLNLLAKNLPANTRAHQLARRPATTRREGIDLYNALSQKLDSQRMKTVDSYFASLAGQKLKNIGITQPPRDLTNRLSQVWLGQNPEENARLIMKKYPYSQGVLAEVMREDALSQRQNMLHRGDPGTPKPEPLGPAEPTPPKRAYFKNPVSDEDKDFVMLKKNDPGDGSAIHIGLPWMSFDEQVQTILDAGDKNPPDSTLNFRNGIAYAIAFNNGGKLTEDELKSFLNQYQESDGVHFDVQFETVPDKNGDYVIKRYDGSAGKNEPEDDKYSGRCAAYAGGALRAAGMKLDDNSLVKVDQLYAELTGGSYGKKQFEKHPQVRGTLIICEGGPLSENGTLSVEEQYAKIVEMGIVKPGDVAFMATETYSKKAEKDLSHVVIFNRAAEDGLYYCGDTTGRYDEPLDYYIADRRTQKKPGGGMFSPYMEIVLFHHNEDEAKVPYL